MGNTIHRAMLLLFSSLFLMNCLSGDLPVEERLVQTQQLLEEELALILPPFEVGEIADIYALGGVADERVMLVRGTALGEGSCPAPLGGACLGLTGDLRILTSSRVSDEGIADFHWPVPAAAPLGMEFCMQAFIKRGPDGVDSVLSDAQCGFTCSGADCITCDDLDSDGICDGEDTVVEFPTSGAEVCSSWGCAELGAGGGGAYYTDDVALTEVVDAESVVSLWGLALDFEMSNSTGSCAAGETFSWDVLVNGEWVGSYSWNSDDGDPVHISEVYGVPGVMGSGPSGTEFEIQIEANETVCPGGGSWNWFPGGTAELMVTPSDDECLIDNGGCDLLTLCSDTSDAPPVCGPCPPGYDGDGVIGCFDVDECLVDNGGCDLLTACTDLEGARECGPCPEGYTGDGETGCFDIDECLVDNGGCDLLTACFNEAGGRTCGPCPEGYLGDGEIGCYLGDEVVSTGEFPTETSLICTSWGCSELGAGGGGAFYTSDTVLTETLTAPGLGSVVMLQLDFEMSNSTGSCAEGETFTFTVRLNGVDVGSYSWEQSSPNPFHVSEVYSFVDVPAFDGFTYVIELQANETVCPGGGSWNWYPGGTATFNAVPSDDECLIENGGCDLLTSCEDSPSEPPVCGSCPLGYTGDGYTGCVDIDECLVDNGGCDSLTLCTNIDGSRLCGECPEGYTGEGELGCLDINECLVDNGGCDELVDCNNIPGGRICGVCPEGYSGDGDAGCYMGDMTLGFPSESASVCEGEVCNILGAGGGGVYYTSDTFLFEVLAGTGITSLSAVSFDFEMSNVTSGCAVGETFSWTVLVNGFDVGEYSWNQGDGEVIAVTETFLFEPILGEGSGEDYTIEFMANETVCSGGGSWNWYSGGVATLTPTTIAFEFDFPTEESEVCTGWGCSLLGAGGGGAYYTEDTVLTHIVNAPGVETVSGLSLNFSMSNSTGSCAEGEVFHFEVRLNGSEVGSYAWAQSSAEPISIGQSYVFEPISAEGSDFQYTVEIQPMETVCPGGGSYNWYPGGWGSLNP